MIDTVAHAAATGDRPQPFAELGLTGDEYRRIRELLGRRPTDCELVGCPEAAVVVLVMMSLRTLRAFACSSAREGVVVILRVSRALVYPQ